MLVSLKEILKIAEARKIAIGAFNGNSLESTEAILDAAEEKGLPVILMHAQIHEEMGLCRLDNIGRVLVMMAEKASVPVCVHLDHGTDLGYLKKGLDLGFTSVMYDGSTLPYEENYANTCVTVELAAQYGASVEAEIGSMGERDSATGSNPNGYTDPEAARVFAESTGIDALACSFGTVHGIYFKEPKLDFDRLGKIDELVRIPLVMHGGSGVSDEDYRRVISLGIRKINYYTYMAKAGGTAVAAMKDMTFFHDISVAAQKAMRENVAHAMSIFAGLN